MWHCQSQRRGSGGGGEKGERSGFVGGAALGCGGAVGVSGSWGEKGEGGMARLEDLKGAGLIVSWRGMMADYCIALFAVAYMESRLAKSGFVFSDRYCL